jgi:threonine aldolase
MVFAKVAPADVQPLARHLADRGVTAIVSPRMRMVTHLDVDAAAIDRAVAAFAGFYRKSAAAD